MNGGADIQRAGPGFGDALHVFEVKLQAATTEISGSNATNDSWPKPGYTVQKIC